MRYVHDELGGRIRFPAPGGPPPGFQLAPFLWREGGRQEALSILWPIRCSGMQALIGLLALQHKLRCAKEWSAALQLTCCAGM